MLSEANEAGAGQPGTSGVVAVANQKVATVDNNETEQQVVAPVASNLLELGEQNAATDNNNSMGKITDTKTQNITEIDLYMYNLFTKASKRRRSHRLIRQVLVSAVRLKTEKTVTRLAAFY